MECLRNSSVHVSQSRKACRLTYSKQLPHVHLISGHKYPFSPQLSIDGAYSYLFDAPKVVKQVAPMSWQYISAPQDGTVFLTWIGGRMQNQFPTDGYVWVDPEQRYTQDFGGYVCRMHFSIQVATC